MAVTAGASSPDSGASTVFEALVGTSPNGMVLLDEHGFITYANAASETHLDVELAGLVGASWVDLCRPEDASTFREALARCLETPGKPVTCELEVRGRGGQHRHVVTTLIRQSDEPDEQVLLHFDQPASDLPGGDQPYRQLFEAALIGLCVTDRECNLLAFNDEFLRPGGYSRDEVLGLRNLGRLFADAEARDRVLRIAQDKGVVWREEVAFLRNDGTTYDALLTLTPIYFQGEHAWYVTVEDVTLQKRADSDRRELEAKLWQAQKMQAVGNMTAGIAHDFKNILAVILTNIDLIEAELGPKAGEVAGDLTVLRATAQRGADMISKLMGFSRSAPLTVEPNNVAEVVADLHPTLKGLIPEDILVEMSMAEQSTARCDRSAVSEMLMNLATNARDAMPEGGTLRIAVGPAHLSADLPDRPQWMTPGDFVRLSVSDNGVGMDESTRARVLEPFFTTKPHGVGTGLGLSMVYGLAKQQGGFVDVLSEPGSGTTVHLYLPAAS